MDQTITCYKCGAQNEFGQRYCVVCGEKFLYRCPQCNSEIEHGNKSCSGCGVKFDWGEPKAVAIEASNFTVDEAADTDVASSGRLRTAPSQKVPWVAIFVFIVVCIGIVFGLDAYLGDKAPMDIPNKGQIESEEAVGLQITSEELSAQYMSDEDMADAMYKGKLLSVTGKITGINKNLVGTYFVKLSGGSIAHMEVQCLFDSTMDKKLTSLEVDDTVTITGVCDGAQGAVKLKDCLAVSES